MDETFKFLVAEVLSYNSLNELFLYHNGVINVKKRIAKKIGKLEKLALATQNQPYNNNCRKYPQF